MKFVIFIANDLTKWNYTSCRNTRYFTSVWDTS